MIEYIMFSILFAIGIVLGISVMVMWMAYTKTHGKTSKVHNIEDKANTSDEHESKSEDTITLKHRIVEKDDSWSEIYAEVTETNQETNMQSKRSREDHAYNNLVQQRIKEAQQPAEDKQIEDEEEYDISENINTTDDSEPEFESISDSQQTIKSPIEQTDNTSKAESPKANHTTYLVKEVPEIDRDDFDDDIASLVDVSISSNARQNKKKKKKVSNGTNRYKEQEVIKPEIKASQKSVPSNKPVKKPKPVIKPQ